MKKYQVFVKQVYIYNDIPAKSKKEAIQKVLDMDWQYHDECNNPLETDAKQQEN